MPITQRVGACPAQLDSEEIHCRYSIRSVVPPNHNFRWAVSATATTFAASVPDFNFSRTCHSSTFNTRISASRIAPVTAIRTRRPRLDNNACYSNADCRLPLLADLVGLGALLDLKSGMSLPVSRVDVPPHSRSQSSTAAESRTKLYVFSSTCIRHMSTSLFNRPPTAYRSSQTISTSVPIRITNFVSTPTTRGKCGKALKLRRSITYLSLKTSMCCPCEFSRSRALMIFVMKRFF